MNSNTKHESKHQSKNLNMITNALQVNTHEFMHTQAHKDTCAPHHEHGRQNELALKC